MLKAKISLILFVVAFIFTSSITVFGAVTIYTYDNLHRLTKVERSDGSITTYQYDELGNRTSMVVTTTAAIDYYCDNDTDGYYDSSVDGTCSGANCPPAGCQATQGNDCNDSDNTIHPNATELCDNKDNDCNSGTSDGSGESWYNNPTTCGLGNCYSIGNLTCTGGSQVDTCTPLTPGTEGPYSDPTCTDTQDNDCDELIDTGDPDCQIPCTDNDTDGYGNPGSPTCTNGNATDCDDNNPVINPGVSDNNCNGVDENCNGIADDGYVPMNTTCGQGVCASTGQWICNAGTLVNTCTPGTPQTEGPYGNPTCTDGIDNDCDDTIDVSDISCGIALPSAITLQRTGQTKCYDSSGAEIACAGTGQDGEIQAGVPWPNPRFEITYCNATAPCDDQSSDCDGNSSTDVVTDKLTGLMWTRDANLPNGTRTWNQAIDYANNLTLCGYSDWWLPNINELESLVNANEPNTAAWLNTKGFTNVQPYYWSSTTVSLNDRSWVVSMWYGYVDDDGGIKNSSNYNYVLPVRSGQTGIIQLPKTGQTASYYAGDDGDLMRGIAWPSPRFADTGIDTVTDNLTGLVWTKDANVPGPSVCSPATTKTWQEALDYVKCLNNNSYLGYNDWRLPNRRELKSLIDYSNHDPALPTGHPFTNMQLDDYWSSTTDTTNFFGVVGAWHVYMHDGHVYGSLKGNYLYVWPVRGGQVGISYYCDDDSDGYIDSSIDGTCTGNGCVPQGCQTNAGDDCNDNNPAIHPGAIEICNGIDDNCNGQTDEGGVCGSTGADLLVSTWTAPATAVPGSTINITDTTKNQGTGTASASTTKLYWSTNSTWDAGDTYLGARPLPALAAGTTNSGSTTVTVPAGACSGTFYIIAKADADNVVAETKETNNTKYKSIKTGPDLIISTLTAPTTSGAGKTISVTDTTKNQGGCPTTVNTITRFYLSSNSAWDALDTPIGERTVLPLAAGASSGPVSTNVTIPAGTVTKTWYIIARADAGSAVTETIETNNNKSKSIKIGPDLIVYSLSAPSSAARGLTISVTDTTKNSGGGTAGTSTTKLYLSTNTTYDAGDTYLGERAVLSLSAGATSSGSTSVTIPSGITTGTYYIIARADADGVVPEINENNNNKSKSITITP